MESDLDLAVHVLHRSKKPDPSWPRRITLAQPRSIQVQSKQRLDRKRPAKLLPRPAGTVPQPLPLISRIPAATKVGKVQCTLAAFVNNWSLDQSWIGRLPRYLDHSRVLDVATSALIEGFRYRACSSDASALALSSATAHYGKALQLLHAEITRPREALSDQTLAAVAVISLLEVLLRDCPSAQRQYFLTHSQGITAILTARPREGAVTDMTCWILYSLYHSCVFMNLVMEGKLCPLDNPLWRELLATTNSSSGTLIGRIEHTSLQIFIRAPAVIILVRQLRQASTPSQQLLDQVCLRLREMLDLEDVGAESELLHRFKIVQTRSTTAQDISPYSFAMSSKADCSAATIYWVARLVVLNLCVTVIDRTTSEDLVKLDTEQILSTRRRIIANIFMSCQHQADNATPIEEAQFVIPAMMSWASMMTETKWRDLPAAHVRDWLLPHILQTPDRLGLPAASYARVDAYVDVFMGGPLIAAP